MVTFFWGRVLRLPGQRSTTESPEQLVEAAVRRLVAAVHDLLERGIPSGTPGLELAP
jgi:hypothetical protein